MMIAVYPLFRVSNIRIVKSRFVPVMMFWHATSMTCWRVNG